MARGILLVDLYGVRLALLASNYKDKLTVRIFLIRQIILLLGGGLIGFPIHAPPFILGLQGP